VISWRALGTGWARWPAGLLRYARQTALRYRCATARHAQNARRRRSAGCLQHLLCLPARCLPAARGACPHLLCVRRSSFLLLWNDTFGERDGRCLPAKGERARSRAVACVPTRAAGRRLGRRLRGCAAATHAGALPRFFCAHSAFSSQEQDDAAFGGYFVLLPSSLRDGGGHLRGGCVKHRRRAAAVASRRRTVWAQRLFIYKLPATCTFFTYIPSAAAGPACCAKHAGCLCCRLYCTLQQLHTWCLCYHWQGGKRQDSLCLPSLLWPLPGSPSLLPLSPSAPWDFAGGAGLDGGRMAFRPGARVGTSRAGRCSVWALCLKARRRL